MSYTTLLNILLNDIGIKQVLDLNQVSANLKPFTLSYGTIRSKILDKN